MKPCGCVVCNDLRYIEPAKYIGGGDDEFKNLLPKQKKRSSLYITMMMARIDIFTL